MPVEQLSRRKAYSVRKASLEQERTSWDSHWRELGEYISPRRSRFLLTDANRGDKKNSKIIDATATYAVRTLQSGMVSGVTSPARPWFNLQVPVPSLRELASVKDWLHTVTTRMRDVLLESNFYTALPVLYGDIGVFGTGAMAALEDDDTVVRFTTFPIGSYYISANRRGIVDCFIREFRMTVRQLVEQFGADSLSLTAKLAWEAGRAEEWIDVCHIIEPNPDADANKLESKFKPYRAQYFEVSSEEEKYLAEEGFDEFPVLVVRWATTGEDVWGSSPGMDALPDIKSLQLYEKRAAQAIEKIVNPALIGPTSLRNSAPSNLPGSITYADTRDGLQGLKPIHDVNWRVNEVEMKAEQIRMRVRRAFYEDLFLMLANDRRSGVTAREIDERHEEKLLALGPVLERLNDELLDPLIDRIFSIMVRKGLVPPPPPELEGLPIKVEYISIMAQAQKMVGIAGVDRLIGFAANLVAITRDPGHMDKIDTDQAIDEMAEMLGTSPRIVRSDELVASIKKGRADQQAAQQKAEMGALMAQSAKTLSETDTEKKSALTDTMRRMGAQ